MLTIVRIGMHTLSVGVSVGGVQGKEVRILTCVIVICGVGSSLQIIVDVESLVGLIVGCRIEFCVIIVITVVFAGGVRIDLEQVVTLTQIMLTHNAFPGFGIIQVACSEQNLSQGIVVDSGVDTGATGVFVRIVQIIQVGDGSTAVVIVEGEIQRCLILIGDGAGGHMGPGFAMAAGRYIHADLRRMQIDQGTIVKDMGGNEIIGADRICHISIVLADIVGACHPIRIQHRVLRHGNAVAGEVIVASLDIDPTRQLIVIFSGALPSAGKLHFHTGINGICRVIRAAVAHDVAVGAVQPQGHLGRRQSEIENGAFVLVRGIGKCGVGQQRVSRLPCAAQSGTVATVVERGLPFACMQRSGRSSILVGMDVYTGKHIADVTGRFTLVIVGFFEVPIQDSRIFHIRGEDAVADLELHRIAVAVNSVGSAVSAGGVDDETVAAGQQCVAVGCGLTHRLQRVRDSCRIDHQLVAGIGDAVAGDHRILDMVLRLNHRIVHIAFDHRQDKIEVADHHGSGFRHTVLVLVQEYDITGHRLITAGMAV